MPRPPHAKTRAHLDFDREDNLIEDEETAPKSTRRITPEREQQVLDLAAQGKSQDAIARELGMSKIPVNRIIREYREQ